MNNLTESMKKTLLQIGYGVTGRRGGFFDVDNNPVDMRSAQALLNRHLAYATVTGGNPMRGVLDLTDAGAILFEELRYTPSGKIRRF